MKVTLPLGRLLLRLAPQDKPVPLSRIRLLRRLSIGADSLSPPNAAESAATGRDLRNPFLADLFASERIGVWTLGATTLNYLETVIRSERPRHILEFGSGISTVCLARYMAESGRTYGARDAPAVISIDQSADAVQKTRDLLERAGLVDQAAVFYAPLEPRAIEGLVVNCYALPGSALETIAATRPDFVLIDGPFAEPGARFGTLPLVRSHLAPGARLFLDDALRDGEIDAALLWTRLLDGVSVEGVLREGKGLLVGCVA